jgi:hypothetical protein
MHNIEYDAKGRKIERSELFVKKHVHGDYTYYGIYNRINGDRIIIANTPEEINIHLEYLMPRNLESVFNTMHKVRRYTVIWYL